MAHAAQRAGRSAGALCLQRCPGSGLSGTGKHSERCVATPVTMHHLEIGKRTNCFWVDGGSAKRANEGRDQAPDEKAIGASEEEERCGPAGLQVLESTTHCTFGMFKVR